MRSGSFDSGKKKEKPGREGKWTQVKLGFRPKKKFHRPHEKISHLEGSNRRGGLPDELEKKKTAVQISG